MTMDIELIAKIISPIATLLIGAIVKRYFEQKAKLVSFIGHISSFVLQDAPRTHVFTHSIVVRNAGSKPAFNVRIGHNLLPPNIQVHPPIRYTVDTNPEGAGEILIPVLVPREQVTISYLYFPPTTWNQIHAYTKSDEGLAKILNVIPIPQPPKMVIALIWCLMFFGAMSIIYMLIRLIPFLLAAPSGQLPMDIS